MGAVGGLLVTEDCQRACAAQVEEGTGGRGAGSGGRVFEVAVVGGVGGVKSASLVTLAGAVLALVEVESACALGGRGSDLE
ncbi:hypothetical protein ACWCXB_30115 [Streptomyces sp. NPDC001514]